MVTGIGEQNNICFQLETNHDNIDHPYDHININRATPQPTSAAYQVRIQERLQGVQNKQQQAWMIIQRKLFLAMAVVVVLSFLASFFTLILTIIMVSGNSSTASTDVAHVRGGNDLFSEVNQSLYEIKKEIRALKENLTRVAGGNCLVPEVKEQLSHIKEEIRALRQESGKVYKNCAEVYRTGHKSSGVYKVDPDGLGETDVFCDQNTAGGGWTVFQKRQDGSVDFYRGWDDYKRGFGHLNGEFWLGLDNIHRLTKSGNNKLRVDLELHQEKAFAEYSFFAVDNETDKYKLSLSGYSGTAGDSFSYHKYQVFTTNDRDNDMDRDNCAMKDQGAWWYKDCYQSNLNGLYLNGTINGQGIVWFSWKNDYISATRSEMKVRPKDF